ncbi:hypothetical protein NDU88_006739 [Pleurodeles waltl]|uniref:Uncharacterized protein n=1 Tax=Pleurodeles waltl TaxID=8319 RepID=A0AAV7WEB5_PLEWA|nr:hypothetical protein NDU88_006739 [Pleurodeles waltl]
MRTEYWYSILLWRCPCTSNEKCRYRAPDRPPALPQPRPRPAGSSTDSEHPLPQQLHPQQALVLTHRCPEANPLPPGAASVCVLHKSPHRIPWEPAQLEGPTRADRERRKIQAPGHTPASLRGATEVTAATAEVGPRAHLTRPPRWHRSHTSHLRGDTEVTLWHRRGGTGDAPKPHASRRGDAGPGTQVTPQPGTESTAKNQASGAQPSQAGGDTWPGREGAGAGEVRSSATKHRPEDAAAPPLSAVRPAPLCQCVTPAAARPSSAGGLPRFISLLT